FFAHTAPPDPCPLSLHDALPISATGPAARYGVGSRRTRPAKLRCIWRCRGAEIRSYDNPHNFPLHHGRLPQVLDDHERVFVAERSEEHTSELQSRENLVCRLLLE